ncbi:MAG: hypothetical protein LBE86_03720 [Gemmobacter sp.]|jgi:hypothetical protein|nr:hypothetical protein [Gemmobacter sp.]
MFRFAPAIAATLLLTGTAHAEPVVYWCEQAQNNLIMPEIAVFHDKDEGKVLVLDGLIKDTVGKAISAKVTQDDEKAVSFRWGLNIRDSNNRVGRIN